VDNQDLERKCLVDEVTMSLEKMYCGSHDRMHRESLSVPRPCPRLTSQVLLLGLEATTHDHLQFTGAVRELLLGLNTTGLVTRTQFLVQGLMVQILTIIHNIQQSRLEHPKDKATKVIKIQDQAPMPLSVRSPLVRDTGSDGPKRSLTMK